MSAADRVHMVAREAMTTSGLAMQALRALGHEVKSASSRVDLLPLEREALVATLDDLHFGSLR